MSQKRTVLVSARSFGKLFDDAAGRLRDAGWEILEEREGPQMDSERFNRLFREADAAIVSFHPITEELLGSAKKMKIITKHGIGLDNIDIDAASKNGILVAYAPGSTEDAVPELAVGLLLALSRKIPEADGSVRDGRWQRFLGTGIAGKNIGIVGFGRIGRGVARRLAGFGAQVIIHDPVAADPIPEGIEQCGLESLFARVHFLFLCTPLNDDTYHLINAKTIALMREDAFIINVARGGIVDEAATAAALKEDRVGGYAADVFESEHKVTPSLLECERTVFSPHMGSYTGDSLRLIGNRTVDAILSFFSGKLPEFVANPDIFRSKQDH